MLWSVVCLCLTSHQQLRSYGDGGHRLRSYRLDKPGSSLQSLVNKAGDLSTTQQRLLCFGREINK